MLHAHETADKLVSEDPQIGWWQRVLTREASILAHRPDLCTEHVGDTSPTVDPDPP